MMTEKEKTADKHSGKRHSGRIFFILGIILLIGAAALTAYNIWLGKSAQRHAEDALGKVWDQVAADDKGKNKDDAWSGVEDSLIPMPEVEVDSYSYIGILQIPALGLELPVISEWSYPALRIAPCRYRGSVYSDDLIIAAHNYASHFGHLNRLGPGDSVMLIDMEGKEHRYSVVSMEEIDGNNGEEMIAGEWDLSLFTCNYSGSARFTVRCMREEQK